LINIFSDMDNLIFVGPISNGLKIILQGSKRKNASYFGKNIIKIVQICVKVQMRKTSL
jgi:hypothetical protein